MKMRPLFVGQAPSSTAGGSGPLSGVSGLRLAALLGVTKEEFLRRYPRANLMQRFPGKDGKGDRFNVAAGRRAARKIMRVEPPRVVLLGRHVANSFDVSAFPLMVTRRGATRFLTLPHPSGINLWWNNPDNCRAAEKALRRFVR